MMDEKTKAEWAKDMATAINGMIANGTIALNKCQEHLGQDFGLYQIIALLKLANRDISMVLFEENIEAKR